MGKPIQYRGVMTGPMIYHSELWDYFSEILDGTDIKREDFLEYLNSEECLNSELESEWGFFPVSAERLDALKADEENNDE